MPVAGPVPAFAYHCISPLSPEKVLRKHPWGVPPALMHVSQWPLLFQNTQCIPEGLESYYAEQDSSAREKFYTVINHYNLAKQSITRSVSPWMSVLSEEKLSEQETEAAEKSAQ